MEDINVKVKLKLDDNEAKQQLENFQNKAKKQDIKVKLDFSNIESQTGKINKTFNEAFKISNSNDLDKVEKKLKEINNLLSKQKDFNKNIKPDASIKGLDSSVKEYLNIVKKLENLNAELHKAKTQNNSEIVKALNNEIQLYQRKQLEIASSIRANNQLSDSVRKLVEQEENLARARTNTKNAKVDTSNFRQQQSELNRLNAEHERYLNKLTEIQNKLNSMKQFKGFLDEGMVSKTNALLEQTRHSLNANGIESDFKEISNSISHLENNLKSINLGNTLSKQEANFNVSLEKMKNKLEQFIYSVKDIKGTDGIIEKLAHEFNSINTNNIEKATIDLRNFTNSMSKATHEVVKMNHSEGFFSKFGKDFKENLFSFTTGDLIADGIRNVAYGMKDVVMDLDEAFTELKKVADPKDIMNVKQLDKISDTATNIAKNVGQSSSDVIRSIADTIQMTGKSMGESTVIAEQTMKLANVADMTQKQATEGVATMVSAFHLDAFKQIPIVVDGVTKSVSELENSFDKLNYVGNNFSISSAGLVESLQSGAALLHEYGVSMTDTFAMVTAANTTLQDPKRVGNGLKSIGMNLRGIKTDADSGNIALNKTAKGLREIAKIDIYEDKKKGKIKGVSKILEELAGKWKSFNDEQKAAIAEGVAGKHQGAVFMALMNNFKTYKKVQSDLNSGKQFKSMQKENEQYVQSLSGQLNRLKETWIGVFNDIFDKRLLAGALKGLNLISDAIGKVVSAAKEIGVLQPAIVGLLGLLAFKQAKGIVSTAKNLKHISGIIKGLGKSSSEIGTVGETVASSLGNIGKGAQQANEEIKTGGSVLDSFKIKLLSLADKPSVIFGGYAIAAAAGVYAVKKAYEYFHETADEQSKRTSKQVENRRKEVKLYDDQISKLQALQKEYDKLHGKKDKSEDDLERIKELNNEIAKIKPDLVVGHDKDGNAIIALTGDVKGLISELKSAQKEKKILLQDSEIEDAKSTIRKRQNRKEVGGIEGGSQLLGNTNSVNDLNKLHETQAMYNADLEYYEKKRQEIRARLYTTTGKQNDKAYKQLQEYNLKIAKENEKFREEYKKNLEEIQKNNKKIGENLFGDIENGSKFSIVSDKVKKDFDNLKNVFDYSEVQSEDDLLKTKDALSQLLDSARMGELQLSGFKSSLSDTNAEFKKTGNLEAYNKSVNGLLNKLSKNGNVDMGSLRKSLSDANEEFKKTGNVDNYVNSVNKLLGKAASEGFMDLGNLKKSISEANEEFAKTGDFDAYNKRMDELAERVSKLTGIDKGILKNLFAGLDTSPLTQADDALNKFLNGYGKSARDLQKNDSFALALAEQKKHIESGLEGIESALNSKNLEYKKQVLVDLKTDENLPKQLDDMINTLMASGENEDDILRVARAIMIDLNDDGKVNIEAANKLIEEKFGKGKFKITPDIELSENAKVKGIETVINQLKKRYDGIPKVVKTVIEAEGITAFNQANEIYQAYKNIPDEVKTDLKNNGLENSKSILLVSNLLSTLPPEVVSNIVSNFPDAVKNSKTYDDLLKNLPPEVVTDIIVNGDFTTAEAIKKAIDELPVNKSVIISVMSGLASGNIEQVTNALNSLPPEKRVEVLSSIENALQGIDTVEAKQLKDKIAALKADPKLALSGIDLVNGTPMQPKTTKVTETGSSNVKGKLDNINNTPNKHHHTQATQNGSQGIIGLLRQILRIPNKRHTTTAINNGGHSVLSNLKSIMAISPTKRIVVTTVFNTIGKAVNWVASKFTHVGNVTKKHKTRLINNIETLNVPSSTNPAPMSTGASVNNSNPIPATTGANTGSPGISSSGTVVPMSTNAPSNSAEMDINKIIPSFNFNIDMLKDMENQLKNISNQLSIIDNKTKNAFGNEKINLLNRQVNLLKKQQSVQHELAESMRKQQNEIKYQMLGFGFQFNGDKVLNDVELLLKANRTVDDLDRRVKKDTEGKNQALRNEYDKAKNALDKSKELLNEYANLTFDKIPACSKEWWNLNDKINESNLELLKAKYALSNLEVDINVSKFNSKIQKISSDISLLDKHIEHGYGNETKSTLINKKISLLQKEQEETHNLAESYREQARIQAEILNNQGFILDNNGQILNPQRLKDFAGSDMFSYLKEQINSYYDLTTDKIPKLSVEWWNLQKTIKETSKSMKELKINTDKLPFLNSLEEISHTIDRLHDKLDLLDKKNKYIYGEYNASVYDDKINLLKQEKLLTDAQYKEYLNLYNIMRKNIEPFGAKLDASDLITNYDEVLNSFIGKDNYEQVKNALDEYIKLTRTEIPDAWKHMLDVDNQIKEMQKEKLEVIKKVEDQITNIYKKQVEDRKKLIDEETKSKIDALNKEKDAYNKSRKDADYKDQLAEQKETINKLQNKIDNTSRDKSIFGQKKLQELLDKMKEEQKKLQNMVQTKTDETVNEMFDNEEKKLQNESQKKKDALDKKFSEKNIQQLVNNSLKTGLFTDIDGNIKDLKTTMLDFTNTTTEGMSALGGIVKSELVSNLEVAKQSFKDIADIYKQLKISDYYNSTFEPLKIIPGTNVTNNKQNVTIQYNQPLVVANSVTKESLLDLEKFVQEAEKRITENIVKTIK